MRFASLLCRTLPAGLSLAAVACHTRASRVDAGLATCVPPPDRPDTALSLAGSGGVYRVRLVTTSPRPTAGGRADGELRLREAPEQPWETVRNSAGERSERRAWASGALTIAPLPATGPLAWTPGDGARREEFPVFGIARRAVGADRAMPPAHYLLIHAPSWPGRDPVLIFVVTQRRPGELAGQWTVGWGSAGHFCAVRTS
jgi:hypothetical protein